VRVLGIDHGEVRVGVAISDPNGVVAVPLGVFARSSDGTPEALASLAANEHAELIVVGLPLLADGTAGLQARRARRFGRYLEAVSGLRVVFWDERFTSREATRALIASGASRKRRRSERDASAAAIILQEYLDCRPPNSATVS
jgi:putative Holliday junction resolvase